MADNDLWGALGYTAPGQPQQAPATPAPPDPELKALVASKAAQYGIPSDIADRWVQQESSYNPKATSKKGARGLTQLMPKTAETYGVTDVEDPAQNVEGGAHYLADLKAQFGSWDKALAAYNAGPDAVTKAGGVPDIPETQNYVKTIMGQGTPAVGDDLWGALGYKPASAGSADEAQFTADHPKMVSPGELKPSDLNTYKTLLQGGALKPQDPYGSEHNPFFNTDPKQVPAGGYYVADGKVRRAPGGTKESSALAGLGQGVGDVATTIMHAIPGSDDSDVKNALIAGQMLYGAKYGGDLKSGAGRFTGQLLGSAPMLAGGEAAVLPTIAKVSPAAAEFLAGRAGMGAAPLASRLIPRAASLATAGAATGAGAAGLTSSANEGSLPEQMGQGAVGGALLGVAAPAVENAGGALVRGVRALAEPLTPSGPAKIANRIVGAFSRPAIGAVNPGEIVPGSTPTLATATADPGLAQLERTVRLGPHADQFAARDAQNAQARSDLFDKLKGDEDSVQALQDAREAATAGARETALKSQTKPADIQPVLDTIDSILKGPEGKRSEVVKALSDVRANLHDAAGNPETDAAMLYGVRKGLNDLLSPKASTEKSGAQLAASELQTVRGELDKAIEDAAPGFRGYLKTYADMSKPVDEQQFLQGLKISDMRGNITLARAQAALDKIAAMKAKPGANPAKSISDDTLAQLTALRDDLKRGDNINLARPIGPDTAGHFTTGGRLAQAGVPVAGLAALAHHPVVATAIGGAKLLYGMKDKQIMSEVANRLLDPNPVVAPAVRKAQPGTLKRLGGTALPAAGGMIASRLIPAQ